MDRAPESELQVRTRTSTVGTLGCRAACQATNSGVRGGRSGTMPRMPTRKWILAMTAAAALAGCGSDTEDHGGGDAEHTTERPGMTTPEVAAGEDGHGEIGGSHGEAARGPGATDAHDLELELEPSSLRAGEPGEIAFRVLGPDGEPVTRFEVEHTKQVHLIVVSKDLRHFHHVHPEARGETWTATVRPDAPGDYRVIADVEHDGRQLALTGDLEVAGEPLATGRPAEDARFAEQELTAGRPVTLEFEAPGPTRPYLGAAGHLVILAEGDLEYLHVHPRQDDLAFSTTFPEPGRYVMFLEYRRAGEVRLSRFPVTVG